MHSGGGGQPKNNEFNLTKVKNISIITNMQDYKMKNAFILAEGVTEASHLRKNKSAFTLAEVLITLGIIGVVAALTIPSLITKYKTHEASSRLKKFNSMMMQALILSSNDNGPVKDWDKTVPLNDDGTVNRDANYKQTNKIILKYLAPYLKYVTFTEGSSTVVDGKVEEQSSTMYLADGSSISFWNGDCMDILYDINGAKKPNLLGYDSFSFNLCTADYNYIKGKAFGPYLDFRNTDRETALNNCKTAPEYCSGLLQYDSWEFKEDYPYKF